MPARGRRRPRRFQPAERYIARIQALNPDQERLKAQLAQIFDTDDRGSALVTRFKQIINDGLLISKEVGHNPEFFRRPQAALESRDVYVPPIVHDTTSGSFIAKRVIDAIWSSEEERVNRYSLLLEYHNIRRR